MSENEEETAVITTTLNKIKAQQLAPDGWDKLLAHLGKTEADDEPLPYATILASNGLDYALWCGVTTPEHSKLWRLYAVDCARRVQDLMTDPRSLAALDAAEKHACGRISGKRLRAFKLEARAAALERECSAAADAAHEAAWCVAHDSAAMAASLIVRPVEWAKGLEAFKAKSGYDAFEAEVRWQTQEFLRIVS